MQPKCPKCNSDTFGEFHTEKDGKKRVSYFCMEHGWQPRPYGKFTRRNPKPGDYREGRGE
jgi:hypothetical protein